MLAKPLIALRKMRVLHKIALKMSVIPLMHRFPAGPVERVAGAKEPA